MLKQTEIHRDENGVVIARFSGRLTHGSSLGFTEAEVNQLIDNQNIRRIIFDLSDVEYMDSAGLGFIVMTHGKLQTYGGQLRIASPSQRVLELLRMTHTEGLLQIDSEPSESMERLKA